MDSYRRFKTVLACIRLANKIARQRGGVDVLMTRLSALDEELSGASLTRPCPACGSTEWEPTETQASADGIRFARLRCKACGQEFGQPQSGS